MVIRSSGPAQGNPPPGDLLIQRHHPVGEHRSLCRVQVGAGHPHHYGGVRSDDVEIVGVGVVLVVRPALEPGVENAAAVLIAFAVNVAPAVEVVGLGAWYVLPERRLHLVAVPIGKSSSQDRGPRAVGLQGDGLHAVRLVDPGHLGMSWLATEQVLNERGVDQGSFNYD